MKAIPSGLLLLSILIEASFLSLRWLRQLDRHLGATILLYLLSSLVYMVSAYFAVKIFSHRNINVSNRLCLFVGLVAVVFRLTVWPLSPALSGDIFRYRWEGMLQAEGGNPYQVRPNDPDLAKLRDETFPQMAGKDFKAGYGPLVELLERWTYGLVSRVTPDPFAQAFWFKAPFAVFDLGVIVALMALLRARGLPAERALIYAWSPLPVLEFWAMGHNDPTAILFVVLALLAASKKRWTWAFASLSLAAAAKIWPLILFPVFIGWKRWRPVRWYQWWVALPIFGALCWPYWSNVTENARFLSGFMGGWRNNDSLFGLLLWASGDIYRAKYLAFGIVIAMALFTTARGWPLEKATLAILATILFVSANCHPWYLSWVLPLLAFFPVPALLLWTALMPLAYRVLFAWMEYGEWLGSTQIRWWIYGPVFALLAGQWIAARWRRAAR